MHQAREPRDARLDGGTRSTIILLSIGTFFFAGSLHLYASILSPFAERLGASLTLIGLIGASYGFLQLLTRVPLGYLSDQGFGKWMLRASPLVSGLACLGFALSRIPQLFVLWRGLAGLGGAALVAFPPYFAHSLGSGQTTRAMGLFTFSFALGQTFGALLGGELAQSLGWRAPFPAGLALATMAWVMIGLATRRPGFIRSAAPPAEGSFLKTVSNPALLLVIALAVAGNFAHVATVITFVPVRAVGLGASASQLGLLLAATMGAVTLGNLAGGVAAGRVERRWVAAVGFLFIGLMSVAIPQISHYGFLVASQMLSGFGWGLVVPTLMAAALDSAGESRQGATSGAFQWGVSWGTLGGPAIGGLIAESFGLSTAFWVCGAVPLFAFLYLLARPLAPERVQASGAG